MSPERVPGVPDVFGSVLEAVSAAIASAARAAGSADERLEQLRNQILGETVDAAVTAGSDLVAASKAMVLGSFSGSGTQGAAALLSLSRLSGLVVRRTAERGGDLAAVTKGLLLGSIACAVSIGAQRHQAAAAAARGSLEGASQSGPAALDRVRTALRDSIRGIPGALTDVPERPATT